MDFHKISRRKLQALCKHNGIRANVTNDAMIKALEGLSSVSVFDYPSVLIDWFGNRDYHMFLWGFGCGLGRRD